MNVVMLYLISPSLVPPHVPSCEVPSSVFVGSSLELLCKDKLSIPPASYRWYKDNKALTATADTPYSIDTNKGTLVSSHLHTDVLCVSTCEQQALTHARKRRYTSAHAHTVVALCTSSYTLSLLVWSRNLKVCPKWMQGCIAVSLPTVSGHPRAAWHNNLKSSNVSMFSSPVLTRRALLTDA